MAYCADPGGEEKPGYKPEVLYLPQAVPFDDEGGSPDIINVPPPPPRVELPPDQFVAMSRLQLEHLPNPLRSEPVLEAIKAVGARVVRVTVNKLSPARRGTFADIQGDLDRDIRKGTGFAVFIHTFFIIASTNRHVVFDDLEARHSYIEFFAGDKETWLQDVRFFKGHGVISAHSDHDFALVVYWLQRGDSSIMWDPESVRRHKDLTPFSFPHLAYTHSASPTEYGASQPETAVPSDTTSDAGAKPKCNTSRGDVPTEETETTAEKFVCVISHPEGDTKHVSFGRIVQENDDAKEIRHTAPTRNGSSGAPILIFSPRKTGVPPNNIWYHCSQLIENPRIKVAKLQPNSAQLFAVEFNRGLVGWKLISDLLDKLEPRQSQSCIGVGAGGDGSLSQVGKGESQEKDKEPLPVSYSPSGHLLITNNPSGLTVACKLLYWIYAAGQATLRLNFRDLPETSSSQQPAVQPPPPSARLPAPSSSPALDHACLVAVFQRLVSQVCGLLGVEEVDSLMHPVSFLTLAKAVKDLHSAVHSHDPCCCPELSLCGDVPAPSAGLEPQPSSSSSGPTTPSPQLEMGTGCLLQSTLELLSAFLSDPGVTVLASLPVLNLLFRLATHLVRVVVLHQALPKKRMPTTEPEKASALTSTSYGSPTESNMAAKDEDKLLLAELTAIFAECFGSFLSISDAWTQMDPDWTKAKPSEVTTKDVLEPMSGKLQFEKSFTPCFPDDRVVERQLKALQNKLQKSCSRREKSTTPTDSQSLSASQQEEDTKSVAVMAAIINAFPYMYRGLDDSQGRSNVCQRFQAVQGGDRSQEIRRLRGELGSVLQAAHGVLDLAKSAWEELRKVEDGSTQEPAPAAQGSSATSRIEARSGASGNLEEKKRENSETGRERAGGESHDSSSSEQATADQRLSEDQTEAARSQTEAKQQKFSTPSTGMGPTKQSEFPPPSEPEHQIFFILNMIGTATLFETGRFTSLLQYQQEREARLPSVTEARKKLKEAGGHTMMQCFLGAISLDILSPEDERFKANPKFFNLDNRFGRSALVEGLRQLSDMRIGEFPSPDEALARVREAKEAMARQAAQTQEVEASAGSSGSIPEAAAAMDVTGSNTSQDSRTDSRPCLGDKAGVEETTEDKAASNQNQNAASQDSSCLRMFMESYKECMDIPYSTDKIDNLSQNLAAIQRRDTQSSPPPTPPTTKP